MISTGFSPNSAIPSNDFNCSFVFCNPPSIAVLNVFAPSANLLLPTYAELVPSLSVFIALSILFELELNVSNPDVNVLLPVCNEFVLFFGSFYFLFCHFLDSFLFVLNF